MTEQSTALATSEQKHPLAEQLERRAPALAEMLPGGDRAAQRFKRVVIQAVVKTPSLMECTQTNAGMASLMSAVMEAATLGIEPTGVLGGAHLVPYKGKAQLIIGYRGLIELARRSGEIETIEARVVREGDDFAYQYGTDAGVTHVPNIDAGVNRAMTYVYAVAKLRGGGVQFEVMTRQQVDEIRNGSSGYKYAESKGKADSPWHTSYDEMARKTVVRRLVKYLPIAVEARDLIERDDSREFEPGAVVARVSGDERAASARNRIAERAAAMRGERIDPVESEGASDGAGDPARQSADVGHAAAADGSPAASEDAQGTPAASSDARTEPAYSGEVIDVDSIPFDEPAGDRGDPWMRKLHAVGAERGMDHDALHDLAAEAFGVDSLSALDTPERAELLDRVESMSMPEGAPADARPPAPTNTPETDRVGQVTSATDGGAEAEGSPPATDSAPPPALPADPDTMRTFAAAVLGYELADVWGLGDLTPPDWEQVWDALDLPSGEPYAMWYGKLKRPLRQALMAAKQSPRGRADGLVRLEAEASIDRAKEGVTP